MLDPYDEDFFVVNRWILRCAGLWKPESKNKTIQLLFTIYAAGIFLFVNVIFTCTEFLSMIYTYNNEYDLIKNFSLTITHVMGAGKVIFFHSQGDNLIKIMATLESTDFHYESNSKRKFFPGFISRSYKKAGMQYSLIFFIIGHVILISSYIPPTIAALQYKKGNPEKFIPKNLPYHSWMPFNNATFATYVISLGYQALSMFSFSYSIVGMDTLFMNMLNCIGMNLEIIQGAFASLRDRAVEKSKGPSVTPDGLHNSQELKITLNQEMKKVCRHLQIIYKVCEELEHIYTFLNMAQSLTILFIFCSCFYLVSMTPINSEQFSTELVSLIAVGIQLMLYCWFGNEITLKADKIPFYIWQCDWITADSEFKRAMILTMARANKPIYFTAGKFAPLTLDTFVAIVKASYSFCAFLKNTSE